MRLSPYLCNCLPNTGVRRPTPHPRFLTTAPAAHRASWGPELTTTKKKGGQPNVRLNKSEPSTASVYENITDDCKPNVGQTCNPSNFFAYSRPQAVRFKLIRTKKTVTCATYTSNCKFRAALSLLLFSLHCNYQGFNMLSEYTPK